MEKLCVYARVRERKRGHNHVVHTIYLFKMSICWVTSAWLIQKHTSPQNKACPKDEGTKECYILFFCLVQIAMKAYSHKKVIETQS